MNFLRKAGTTLFATFKMAPTKRIQPLGEVWKLFAADRIKSYLNI